MKSTRLRIQPAQPLKHKCAVCDEMKICHHRDLDFRWDGTICDDCAQPVKFAEIALINAGLTAPLDRDLDEL